MKYTTEQIFRHMTPNTLASWIGDMDTQPGDLEPEDLALMCAAIDELFALVGMEALDTLETHGVYADNPLVADAVEAYNKDGG